MSDGASAGSVRQAAARPDPGPARDPTRMRPLLAGLLIVLVIFGSRALPALGWHESWRGPWHDQGTAIDIGMEVALACLLGWLLAARRRRKDAGWLAARLGAWLTALIPLAMILSAIELLRYLRLPSPRPLPRHKTPPAPPPPAFRVNGHQPLVSTGAATIIEYTVLALIILLIVTAALILLRHIRRAERRERLTVSADDTDVVRDAVEAGRTALTGVSDARLAIIACYLAMEGSLAATGTTRRPAETADELLARATLAGLLRGDPPARLTALFNEARFSRHDVPAAARTAALDALDIILADLGGHELTGHDPVGAHRDDQAVAP